jgi:hypothetical protein
MELRFRRIPIDDVLHEALYFSVDSLRARRFGRRSGSGGHASLENERWKAKRIAPYLLPLGQR